MRKKLTLTLGIILSFLLSGCGLPNVDVPLDESKEVLTEETLQKMYPDAEIKFTYFFGDDKAAVVICEQQGMYFVDTIEHNSIESQRVWNLLYPPVDITMLDSDTLYIVGIEAPPWTRERPATDLPEELMIKWSAETGFKHNYKQHWAQAAQSHTYGYGNSDEIYAVLNKISADENSISFTFGPGAESEQEDAFYAAIARAPRMVTSFDGQLGEIILYDVKVGTNDLTTDKTFHVQQDGNNTLIAFTCQKPFQRYSLNTKYQNALDPVVVLMFAE